MSLLVITYLYLDTRILCLDAMQRRGAAQMDNKFDIFRSRNVNKVGEIMEGLVSDILSFS